MVEGNEFMGTEGWLFNKREEASEDPPLPTNTVIFECAEFGSRNKFSLGMLGISQVCKAEILAVGDL